MTSRKRSYVQAFRTTAYARNKRMALLRAGRGRRNQFLGQGPRPRPRQMSYGSDKETSYVDGYLDGTNIHALSITADDTWADCELNPRQATAVYGCLPIPRQGTNYADRKGRRIFIKNIRIAGRIDWSAVTDAPNTTQLSMVRILVVKDTRTNGVPLSAENVLGPGLGSDGLATTSGDGVALQFLTNPDGWGRYKIMSDRTYRAPPQPVAGTGANSVADSSRMSTSFKLNIKANCQVDFSATTGAIGSVVDNSFHVIAACLDSNTEPVLSYYARTSFTG